MGPTPPTTDQRDKPRALASKRYSSSCYFRHRRGPRIGGLHKPTACESSPPIPLPQYKTIAETSNYSWWLPAQPCKKLSFTLWAQPLSPAPGDIPGKWHSLPSTLPPEDVCNNFTKHTSYHCQTPCWHRDAQTWNPPLTRYGLQRKRMESLSLCKSPALTDREAPAVPAVALRALVVRVQLPNGFVFQKGKKGGLFEQFASHAGIIAGEKQGQ
ncbi:hypothetical protein Anapl_17532 [Anas platyrhynchos]|uniref:Uncharacterized protein n=1 Tax=Anas platyrhynchos TaxID=8839 RepID=R0K287_ANAPL|nr:hypothetical protein Anapl_17532 [Anas platyrhynchos]